MKNKSNMLKRARRQVKGLIIRWEDKNPLVATSDVIPGEVTHSNPVMRMSAAKMFNDYSDWICHKQPFRWLITITGVFSYENGTDQNEIRELEAFCTIDKINDVALEQVEDIRRHGSEKHYKTTKFEVRCINYA